tara:strand:+ start:59845 stop:60864 length:1020 start_codon:yes stop_codon:yes gene_type:complete
MSEDPNDPIPTGWCCSPPGGPSNCKDYTPAEREEKRKARAEALAESQREAAKARAAAEARAKATAEWNERREREKAEWQAAHDKSQREHQAYREKVRKLAETDETYKKRWEAILEQERAALEREEAVKREQERRQEQTWAAHEKRRRQPEIERQQRLRTLEKIRPLGFSYGLRAQLSYEFRSEPTGGPGAGIAVGALWRSSFKGTSLGRGNPLLAVGTFGITAIPYSVWLGNEHGLIMGASMYQSNDSGATTRIDIVPYARVLLKNQLWRTSSVLEVFSPRMGLEGNDDKAFVVAWPRFSIGYQMYKDVLVDLSIARLQRRSEGRWGSGGVVSIGVSGF